MIDFKFSKKRLLWIKEKTFLSVNLCFLFDCGWFHFFPDSAQPIPPPAPDTPREQLQTGLPRDLIQVSTAPHNAFATPCNLQISILAQADWRSRTTLISDAATGLASITTEQHHNNKINLPSYRFWGFRIKCTLQCLFFQENSFDTPSYMLDRSSLLKSNLAC